MTLVGTICCCDSAGQCDLSPRWCGVCTSTFRKTKTLKSHFQHLKLYLQPCWAEGQQIFGMAPSLLHRSVCRDMNMPGPAGQPAQLRTDGEVCFLDGRQEPGRILP